MFHLQTVSSSSHSPRLPPAISRAAPTQCTRPPRSSPAAFAAAAAAAAEEEVAAAADGMGLGPVRREVARRRTVQPPRPGLHPLTQRLQSEGGANPSPVGGPSPRPPGCGVAPYPAATPRPAQQLGFASPAGCSPGAASLCQAAAHPKAAAPPRPAPPAPAPLALRAQPWRGRGSERGRDDSIFLLQQYCMFH